MTERTFLSFLFSFIFAVAAALVFYLSPDDIFEDTGIPSNSKPAIEQKVRNHLSTVTYEQYKTKTLPSSAYVANYIEDVEESIAAESNAASRRSKVGETAPHGSWKFFAGMSGFGALIGFILFFADSRFYRSLVEYWRVKSDLKKALNDEQIKLVKSITETRAKFE